MELDRIKRGEETVPSERGGFKRRTWRGRNLTSHARPRLCRFLECICGPYTYTRKEPWILLRPIGRNPYLVSARLHIHSVFYADWY